MDVGEGSLHDVGEDTSIIAKRQASGAMCVSLFAIIISLVSIIFALEAYAIAEKDANISQIQHNCQERDDCPAGFATLKEMSSLVEEIRVCKELKK